MSYRSFWIALLRLVPGFVVAFIAVAVFVSEPFAVRSFASLPFVFAAATLGFAVRAFDRTGMLVSVLIAGVYSFLLEVGPVADHLLRQPTPMLSVLAVLTFGALLVGFSARTLHGQRGGSEFERARREWKDN
ncbi:MAG: hypothetical protein ACOCQU_03705 [Halolamina sp.]